MRDSSFYRPSPFSVLKKRPELLIHEISLDLFESCHVLVSQKDLTNIQFHTLSL